MTDHSPGLCQCGCGQATRLAPQTHRAKGWIFGEPVRFVQGHNWKNRPVRGTITAADYTVTDRGYLTPCWIVRTSGRYGGLSINGTGDHRNTHRAMYEQEVGPIPTGFHVDHLCVQTDCIRPDHLEAVTPTENIHRSRVTKLTAEQVVEIRASTESSRILAQRFPVQARQIRRIRQGVRWADHQIAAAGKAGPRNL